MLLAIIDELETQISCAKFCTFRFNARLHSVHRVHTWDPFFGPWMGWMQYAIVCKQPLLGCIRCSLTILVSSAWGLIFFHAHGSFFLLGLIRGRTVFWIDIGNIKLIHMIRIRLHLPHTYMIFVDNFNFAHILNCVLSILYIFYFISNVDIHHHVNIFFSFGIFNPTLQCR